MTFAQFISILRARWRIALGVLAGTVVLVLSISLILPPQYKAEASVVVDQKPDPVSAVVFGGMPSPGLMATQVDMIQSDRVARRVIRDLKLASDPDVRQQWLEETDGQGDIETWLSFYLQKKMDVVPSRESSVITVTYKAPDPRFAAGMANAFVRAYISTSLELRVDPAKQYASFFDTRSKEAREALEKAQVKLSAFQGENGIIATDERLDVETARLNELSSQLTAIQAITSESNSRQTQAQGAQGDRLQEVLGNPVVGQLKADINRGEAHMRELTTRYGEAHPQVQEARANLVELRARLDAEVRRVTASLGLNSTVNRQRETDVRAQLEAQRAKVLRMKAVRNEGMVLQSNVDNAQLAYNAVVQRLAQTSLEGQVTQNNVNVLTEAVPPLKPASPRILLNTVAAIFLGALLGISVAMLRELNDRRLRNIDDVLTALSLPVLGVLPKPVSKRRRGQPQISTMQQRLLGPLAQNGKGA